MHYLQSLGNTLFLAVGGVGLIIPVFGSRGLEALPHKNKIIKSSALAVRVLDVDSV
jgi:hypothetical protein